MKNGRLEEIENSSDYPGPEEFEWLINRVKTLTKALEFYANKDSWKDVWEYQGKPSEDFKYFYMLRARTKDFDLLSEPYHYYAGSRARKALEEDEK